MRLYSYTGGIQILLDTHVYLANKLVVVVDA